MKNLRSFNNFVVIIPIVLGLLGFIESSFWGIALLSTIITGVAQVVFAICYAADNPNNTHIYIYFLGVVIFFILWFILSLTEYIAWIPPVLALYLTAIFYSNYKPESHEP